MTVPNATLPGRAARHTGPAPAAPAPHSFRPDIEGLRGVAILLVVAYHAGIPGTPGGYVGVDVFFVLSGYLITGLLVAEIERTGRLDLRAFYARRVRRLLPAAALMLAVTLALGAVLLAPLQARSLASMGVATALYSSNLWLAMNATDYLSSDGESNPLLHTWSLAVEEQFYLMWPLLVILAMRMGRGKGRRPLLLAVLAVSLVSLAGSVWLTGVVQPWAFFASPARAWEFGFGALGWMAGERWLGGRPRASRLAAWLGVAALAFATLRFGSGTAFPGWAAVVPVLGTVAVLCACGGAHGGAVARALSSRPLQWLGRLSYSWYLWHWPALAFVTMLAADAGLPLRLAVVLLALGVAAATYAWFENPIRFHRALTGRPAASFAMGVSVTAAGLLLALQFQHSVARASARPDQAAFAQAANDRMAVFEASRCRSAGGENARVRACVFGLATSPTTLVLFGDSHAAHWLPALQRIAGEQGVKLVAITKPGCPAARVTVFNRTLRRDFTECDEWRDAAIHTIVSLRPAVVVVASAYTYADQGRTTARAVPVDAWGRGMRETASALARGGARVLVMRDNPRADFSIPVCLSRAAWRGRDADDECSFPRSTPAREQVGAVERDAVAGLAGVTFVDLTNSICAGGACQPMRDSMVKFRDGSHLTRAFSERLAPALSGVVVNALRPPDTTAR
jgi:peptidoglycan/LPS O-acetylase OafA/YrhL